MSVWRVEILRVVRTRRLLALLVLYVFLGASGPLIVAYAKQLFDRLSGGAPVRITVLRAVPADGILSYYKSAMQLGLVGSIVVAGLALSLDDRAGLSVYYRTRTRVSTILLPRLVVSAATACGAYTVGLLVAWYETAALLGLPDAASVVGTWALGLTYIAFAVSLTLLFSAIFSNSLGAVGSTIVVVLLLPILGSLPRVSSYLPSRLLTLPAEIFAGPAHPSALSAVLVTVAVAIVSSGVAVVAMDRRR